MTTQQNKWEDEMRTAHFNAEGFEYCVAWNEGQHCCVQGEWFKAYLSKIEQEAYERGIQKAIGALEEEFALQVTSKPRELIQDSVLAGWSQSIRYLQSLLPKDSNQ